MKDIAVYYKICTHEYHFVQDRCHDVHQGSPNHYIGRLKRGRARLVSDSVTLSLEVGDVFYIPKGLVYKSYWMAGETGVVFDSFGFSESPASMPGSMTLQKLSCSQEQLALMDRIASETALQQNSLRVAQDLLRLLSELLPLLAKAKREDRQRALADRAISIIKDDPALDIPAVAAICSVSESGLYAAFRKSGYDTPLHERQKLLIKKAIHLLVTTDTSVEQISADLCFSSSSYFRKIFKSLTGKTPREVRKDAPI